MTTVRAISKAERLNIETTKRSQFSQQGRKRPKPLDYNFDSKRCLFCRTKNKLRTGYLKVTGKIWRCVDCKDKYDQEKAFENGE